MASSGTGSHSGDNSSSGGTSPNSHANYDSDGHKSDSNDEHQTSSVNRDLYICTMCSQPFCDPRVLKCFHVFCAYCLRGIATSTPDPSDILAPVHIECTQCHQKTILKTGSVEEDLPIDFSRRRYLEKMRISPEKIVVCRSCRTGNNRAISRCYECAMFLCSLCSVQHQSLNCYSGHSVTPVGEPIRCPVDNQKYCTMHGALATVYCNTCQQVFCDSCGHQRLYASHRTVVIADCVTHNSLITNVEIEVNKALSCMHYYDAGANALEQTTLEALSELDRSKQRAMQEIERKYNMLRQELDQRCKTTKSEATRRSEAFLNQVVQLDGIKEFMHIQNSLTETWDKVLTKSFLEDRLAEINDLKPENFHQLNFNIDFVPGNINNLEYLELGYISQTGISAPGLTQQQPIARPTSVTGLVRLSNALSETRQHTVNGLGLGFESNGSRQSTNYQNNFWQSTNNRNNACQSSNYQNAATAYDLTGSWQTSNYRNNIRRPSGADMPSSETRRLYGSDMPQNESRMIALRSLPENVRRNSFEQGSATSSGFQVTSSSPMTVSQPNSATMVSESVFDFSLLSNIVDGGNTNNSSNLPAPNQNDMYGTWSSGIDHPSNTLSNSRPVDIFTNTDEFRAPTAQGSRQTRSIQRGKMQVSTKFGEYGFQEGQFTEPSGVAINREGFLLVADTNNHRVQVFDVDGNYHCQFSPTTEFSYPNRIAVSRKTGNVAISERAPTHRVQTFTANGERIAVFGESKLQHPRGIAFDNEDNVVIIECKVMRLSIFSLQGEELNVYSLSEDLQFPNSIAMNDRQEVFICDNREHCVKVFSFQGELLRSIGGEGLTNYPIGVAINKQGEVVIADNHNNFNITVFNQDGVLVSGFESKTKHAQCYDLALTDDGMAIVSSKDYKVYCYPYHGFPFGSRSAFP